MKDKSLSVAFAISITWHIFLIFMILIIILPKGLDFVKFPTVSFLGSILNEDALGVGVPHGKEFAPAYKKNLNILDFSYQAESPVADNITPAYRAYGPDTSDSVLQKRFVRTLQKNFIGDIAKKPPQAQEDSRIWRIEGPLSQREVSFIPPAPELPSWVKSESVELDMEFRVRVLAEGHVISVDRMRSCGHPEIEALFTRYIYHWQFMPLLSKDKNPTMGIVYIKFNVK